MMMGWLWWRDTGCRHSSGTSGRFINKIKIFWLYQSENRPLPCFWWRSGVYGPGTRDKIEQAIKLKQHFKTK
jgi:hypothetical protein